MKKLICIVLALLLLTACGGGGGGTEQTTDSNLRTQINSEEVTFEAWEQDGLPTEGAYYLTRDVELTATVEITGQLQLHLNGHTVSGQEGGQFSGSLFTVASGAEFTIYDEAEGVGAVVSPRSFTGNPIITSMFQVGGTLTVAGGNVDASGISLEDLANGAGFYVQTGGVLNITGGTVTGGTTWCTSLDPQPAQPQETAPAETAPAETTPAETTPAETVPAQPQQPIEVMGKGGTVYVDKGGVCNMSGGVVQNGSAGLGGNFYTAEDAEGGNHGVLNITGGTVAGGEAVFHGGNICVAGTVNMSDGQVSLGQAYSCGGNIYVTGTLEMTGSVVSEGRCDANSLGGKRGGNIGVNSTNAVVHISNSEIRDGDASGRENYGGNVSVFAYGARELTITDSVLSGGRGHRAGNFYVGHLKTDIDPENLDYTLTNVTLSDGSVSYRGMNICIDTKNAEKPVILTLNNCDLLAEEGSSSDNLAIGAGAADVTQCHVTMTGGSIVNGALTIYGSGTLTVDGNTKLTMESHGGGGEVITNP